MQQLREAERKKRSQREAPTINLNLQSDIMADFERGTRQADASFLLGLGLKRTEDEEAI